MKHIPLTHEQHLAITLLATSELKNVFYWTGGTLLAYHYLHHRYSQDLDFFTDKPFTFDLVNGFIQEVKEKAGFTKVAYQKIFDRHDFLLTNQTQLRIEFVLYNHEKKQLEPHQKVLGISVDSLTDIAANKTAAYFDRNEPKDLYDMYYLLTEKEFTPQRLLELAERKFGVTFQLSSFWSEAFKKLALLQNIKPLIPGTEQEQTTLLRQITDYFHKGSRDFLEKEFDQ